MNDARNAAFAPPQGDLVFTWLEHLRRYAHEAGAWLDLSEAASTLPAADVDALLKHVATLDLRAPRAASFRAVFMFVHGHDLEWLAETGRNVAQCGELERLHALLVLVWGLATSMSEDRARFRRMFEAAGFAQSQNGPASALADALPVAAVRPASATPEKVRRVAILCQHLSGFAQAGTRLALEHAAILSAAEHEVSLFSAQEMTGVGMHGWLGCQRQVHLAPPTPDSWKPVAASGRFAVTTPPEAWPLAGRWRQTAVNVAQFSPDVVLFVGFFSPLLYWANRHYPVLGLSVHTLPPLGPIDVWLHQYDADRLPAPWTGIPSPEPFPYAFRLALPPAVSLSLAALGLPPGTRLAVTVGYRLSKEIRFEWAAQMLARLEAHRQWVWLLVGDKFAPPGVPADHPQVRVLSHQEHIDALLGQCDLYINPPRMGGGFSIMNAMARGVAAVSLGQSDGGDKLGPWAVASLAAYWQRLDTFLADDATRMRCGQDLLRRFDALYNLRSATPRLIAALDAARAHFGRRTAMKQ